MTKLTTTKGQRLEHANQLIQIISSHGRRFFYSDKTKRTAFFFLNHNSRVYFVDEYTGKAIYTHKTTFTNKWSGFSHGGTLRALVEAMRDYIVKGTHLDPYDLGPERRNTDDGNIWGYPTAVRREAALLPIIMKDKESSL